MEISNNNSYESIGNPITLNKKINDLLSNKEKDQNVNLILLKTNLPNFNFNYSFYAKIIGNIISIIKNSFLNQDQIFYLDKKYLLLISKLADNTLDKKLKKIKMKVDNKIFTVDQNNLKVDINYTRVTISKEDNIDSLIKKLYKDIENKVDYNTTLPLLDSTIEITKKGKFLDTVSKESTQLFLLAKNENVEIIRQCVVKDKTIQIRGGDEDNFELFYILKGKLYCEEDDLTLTAGDTITVKTGDEKKYFKTVTEVKLLYITSASIFASEQKRITDLLALNKKVANKDIETNEHCNRLQELSRLTAIELGLKEEKLFYLGFASFLHDIGKAKVPANLLKKPGKLTEDEWKIMKQHTLWGKEIILEHFSSNNFQKIAKIINQHHEKYDGTGYPKGLSGDEILLEAQVLSVVDAYDAMIYDRPYQKAVKREEALEEIVSEKEKQFSPKAVEAFLKAEKNYIKNNKQ